MEDNLEFLHEVKIKLVVSASKQAVKEKQSQHLACPRLVSSWLWKNRMYCSQDFRTHWHQSPFWFFHKMETIQSVISSSSTVPVMLILEYPSILLSKHLPSVLTPSWWHIRAIFPECTQCWNKVSLDNSCATQLSLSLITAVNAFKWRRMP